MYKGLEKYNGFYADAEGTQIEYDGDDLLVKAYFLDQNKAMEFQSFLNSWELHKTLILLDGVESTFQMQSPCGDPKISPGFTCSVMKKHRTCFVIIMTWG